MQLEQILPPNPGPGKTKREKNFSIFHKGTKTRGYHGYRGYFLVKYSYYINYQYYIYKELFIYLSQ
jgi:hypothetical protein